MYFFSSLLLPTYVFAFCFGCAIGSFLNVVVWRVPLGLSLLHPPSHCPRCGHFIRPWENIPLLSWLALRGRCSSCQSPISIQYPLGEAATGVLYLALWFSLLCRNLPLSLTPCYFYLAGSLLAIARIDWQHRLIPDLITFPGMLVAFFLALALPASRPAISFPTDPHAGTMIFTGLINWLNSFTALEPVVAKLPPLILAGFDCLLGIGIGTLLLLVVVEAGRRLMPAEKIILATPTKLELSASGIKGWPNDEWQDWDEVMMRNHDRITILTNKDTDTNQKTAVKQHKVIAGKQGFAIEGQWQNWQKQQSYQLTASTILVPREVMGYGDVKCLAMIGAFCGADATIYILLTAAAMAVAWGIVSSAYKRQKPSCIPFGPFLAAATCLWMITGNFIYSIYKLTS